jgi:hypothetical protein
MSMLVKKKDAFRLLLPELEAGMNKASEPCVIHRGVSLWYY